ncbi:MAG: 16S rRNA (guanine(966)-N(2))-methyltransferase RsmD [Desulfovibrionaceae bacterium]|nr:16S rRNA (guanine(966)-N(2))-methyltransferase RsmD [Desulfovibrionaceae bacterium]MBF0514735.1 16S rRNA (guanine(966)-N(2))-methyltransferase RsmD [Desulfovibrionaceae bacterium]
MRITGGDFKGRSLKTAVGPGLRPAMAKARQALFSMLEARGLDYPGTLALDLFAGTGSLGLEALSRGAAAAVFVENYPPALRAIRDNLKQFELGPGRARVEAKDALAYLRGQAKQAFDLIFIDPPYGRDLLGQTLALVAASGFAAPEALIAAEVEIRVDPEKLSLPGAFRLLADRRYGQTRMLLWRHETPASPSTPEPSIP